MKESKNTGNVRERINWLPRLRKTLMTRIWKIALMMMTQTIQGTAMVVKYKLCLFYIFDISILQYLNSYIITYRFVFT